MVKSASLIIFFIFINVLISVDKTEASSGSLYKYELLPAGEIKPAGWIKEQLVRDLTEGYIGRFDQVHNTVRHNVFVNQDRRSNKRFRIIKEWWSGEHEGYWKDAVVRMAFLTGIEMYKRQAEIWINELIENTGEKGYIGIYENCEEPNCRFNHTRENGELWTTSRILMAMLAYYEYTGRKDVLEAAENAARLIMNEYDERNYFVRKGSGGGVSHGIGFFENLEWLCRITGDEAYNEYAKKLYEDFSTGIVRDNDLQLDILLDEDRYFIKHGAHIAEGIFVPTYIAGLHEEDKYSKAAKLSLEKLFYHMTPGGAMRCDEWINGRKGSADELYEYCGIAEMVGPMNRIISITGNLSLGDSLETLVFNAGQGSRFSTLTALSYLTSDNRIKINHFEIGKRESYDAAHRAAACCVLNGGRTMPYYVEGMWMKDKQNNGIAAVLFGPSILETNVNGQAITIKEETNYPFDDNIRFTITANEPVRFPLIIRRPFGAKNILLSTPKGAEITHYNDKIVIKATWNSGDAVDVDFNFPVKKMPQQASKTVPGGGYFLKRGAVVYSLKIDHQIDTIKQHNESGFYRYRIKAANSDKWRLQIKKDATFEYNEMHDGNVLHPFDKPVVELTGELVDKKGNPVPVTLIPEGNTILRRVTFSAFKSK
ncbi:MAG: beta-L-arabinofuranosidase domain-containing protein [Bacteroidota bacterium]